MLDTLRSYIDIITENDVAGENPDWWEFMYGEDMNQIMQRIWKSKYPEVPLYVEGIEDDMPEWKTEKEGTPLRISDDEFYMSTRGNGSDFEEGIAVSIDTAYSGKYRGIIKPYIRACFEHMEQEFKQAYPDNTPPKRVLVLYTRDGSENTDDGTVWERIARSLNAELKVAGFH